MSKTILVLSLAAATLSGCAVVPAEPVMAYPAPVYVAPAPVVVVRPYASYGHYYRGGPRWRHWR